MKRPLIGVLLAGLAAGTALGYSFSAKWPDQPSIMPSRGIAIDSVGNVYIAETEAHRVTKWTMSGTTITSIDRWGSMGSGDGQFRYPHGIAVGVDGGVEYVFVLDSGNHRVQKFTTAGVFMSKWGSRGTGNGELEWPLAIACDNSTPDELHIFVADTGQFRDPNVIYGGHRVQKFTGAGVYETQWGGWGTTDGLFHCPSGITTDANGDVFVVDTRGGDGTTTRNHRVERFDNDGTFILTWGTYGHAGGEFAYPHGVDNGRYGLIYVCDTEHHRMLKFGTTGTLAATYGHWGKDNGTFIWPVDIACEHTGLGDFFILEWGNRRVQKLSRLGAFKACWGGRGTGDKMDRPHDVAVLASGGFAVLDTENNRVRVYDAAGAFDFEFGSEGDGDGEFDGPTSIAVDSSGNMYIADAGNNRVCVTDPTGTFIMTEGQGAPSDTPGRFNQPQGIAVDPAGTTIYVADTGNNRVQLLDASTGDLIRTWGQYGAQPGEFDHPRGIAVSGSTVYVVDTDNHRVQLFDTLGNYQTKWGGQGTGYAQFRHPRDVYVASSGKVFIADTFNHRIVRYSAGGSQEDTLGSFGCDDGLLATPEGVAVDGSGNVYVADMKNHRIVRFAP